MPKRYQSKHCLAYSFNIFSFRVIPSDGQGLFLTPYSGIILGYVRGIILEGKD